MAYLQSTLLQSHGRLKSSCCLISSRWQLKIASYGMAVFKKDELPGKEMGDYQTYKALLWTAPELLRQETQRRYYGTKMGDVYSFGIILQELLYRAMPFFMDSETPKGMNRE